MFPLSTLWLRPPLFATLLAGSALALAAEAIGPPDAPPPPFAEATVIELAEEIELQQLQLLPENEETSTGCLYYSSFDVQPVEVTPGQQALTLHRRFSFMDGCEWESEERLTLASEGIYQYSYREHALSCRPGHVAAAACTRTGFAVALEGETD